MLTILNDISHLFSEDIVPILPGNFLGFHHVSGEIHIEDDGTWVSCSGQDNTNSKCTKGDVTSIFSGDTSDHKGEQNRFVVDGY